MCRNVFLIRVVSRLSWLGGRNSSTGTAPRSLIPFRQFGPWRTTMAHFTRREFLKTGLAAGTLAVSGSLPLVAQRGSATDVVTLGRSGVKVTRLAFGTGSYQRPGTARARAGRVHAAGAPCVRSRHPLLRDGRIVRRDAQDAGRRLEGHSARQLSAHVEGDDPRRRRPAAEVRRAPPPREHRVLRHHAAPLAAHGDMADRHGALAGRDPRGPVTEGRAQPWCVGSRTAGAAPGSRQQVAPGRDDSREPHRQEHGRRGLRDAGSGQRPGSRHPRARRSASKAWA